MINLLQVLAETVLIPKIFEEFSIRNQMACEHARCRMEGERKEEGLYAHLKFYFSALFDISIIYAKCLAHNLGSATKMIINITLIDHFVTFSILNCKSYLHLSIKLQFNNGTMIYQN